MRRAAFPSCSCRTAECAGGQQQLWQSSLNGMKKSPSGLGRSRVAGSAAVVSVSVICFYARIDIKRERTRWCHARPCRNVPTTSHPRSPPIPRPLSSGAAHPSSAAQPVTIPSHSLATLIQFEGGGALPKKSTPSLSLPHSCFRKAWHASYNVGGGRHLPKCQAPVLFSEALAVVVFSRKDRPPPPCHRMDCMSSSRPAHPATSRYVADILETDLGWIVIRMGV